MFAGRQTEAARGGVPGERHDLPCRRLRHDWQPTSADHPLNAADDYYSLIVVVVVESSVYNWGSGRKGVLAQHNKYHQRVN